MYSPRNPIAEFWRGDISLRHLRVLVHHLPAGGAYYREVYGHGWVEREHLLADLIDVTRETTWAVFAAQPRDKGKQGPKPPKPIKRPGQKEAGRIGDRGEHSTEDVIAFLDSLSASKGGT